VSGWAASRLGKEDSFYTVRQRDSLTTKLHDSLTIKNRLLFVTHYWSITVIRVITNRI